MPRTASVVCARLDVRTRRWFGTSVLIEAMNVGPWRTPMQVMAIAMM
jgi:hypothetical protein